MSDGETLRSHLPFLHDGIDEVVEKMAILMDHYAERGGKQRRHERRIVADNRSMEINVVISVDRPGDIPLTYADLGLDEPPERPEDV